MRANALRHGQDAAAAHLRHTGPQCGRGSGQSGGVYALFLAAALQDLHGHQFV